jgi:NO-binding membrane sensor protein with MHYT domain
MTATYNFFLVGLSALIAILASYITLELAAWITALKGFERQILLVMGASIMGIGIWSMHFVAMLAFSLPIAIGYNFLLVVVSLLVAILGAGQALFIISRPTVNIPSWLTGSTCMGIAIAAMHYTGMAAMQVSANIHYKPKLFALSVAIAIVVSLVALKLSFEFRENTEVGGNWGKIASAIVMGVAVLSMHYTGMAATIFKLDYSKMVEVNNYGNSSLGFLIGAFTLLLLVSAVFIFKT